MIQDAMLRAVGAALFSIGLVACGSSPPPPSVGTPPPGTINGTERLGWTQAAANESELATFHYAIYIDGVRSELAGPSCTVVSGSADFSCLAPMPSMSAGAHTLELAAFIVADGAVLESARAGPLQVTMSVRATSPAQPVDTWPRQSVLLADGSRLRLEQMPGEVTEPTDAAFAPDGRVFVAEYGGRVRVARDGQVLASPALSLADDPQHAGAHLVGLAVDPEFARTHFVYTVFSTPSATGGREFTLARFREVADTLADQIVLRDRIPASSSDEGAALRFGADGKLFVAFDDGGARSRSDDLASPNGKLLRLNSDGTTPRDQAGGAPLYSYPYHSPRGIGVNVAANMIWLADRDTASSGRLSGVVANGDAANTRGVVRTTFVLPRGTLPSSVALGRPNSVPALRDNLLVASVEGRHLYRIQFDPHDPTRVAATERLLQDQIGGIRLVAVAPNGTIFLGTSSAFGKLVAE